MTTLSIIKDLNKANERIFIGNLPPNTTREELESICKRYGNVLCSMVQKNFGFVQFDCEVDANKAASALSGSIFKGNRITVRNAAKKPPKGKDGKELQSESIASLYVLQQQHYHTNINNPDYNDCEIIVVNKKNTEYAENIESRLKRLYLKVDILFPNEDVSVNKVLANISSRGCLYAILITPQNEEHQSITVNILYGQPAEHRNMPVEDAINLITNDFQEKLKNEKSLGNTSASLAIPANTIAPPLKERHPNVIQTLLNLLADNLPLTVLQYDHIIKYLNERRELQAKAELGEEASTLAPLPKIGNKPDIKPDPEIELQKKILSILNKASIMDTTANLMFPTVQSLLKDPQTIELLKDAKIQAALNSLMTTSLVQTIEEFFKF